MLVAEKSASGQFRVIVYVRLNILLPLILNQSCYAICACCRPNPPLHTRKPMILKERRGGDSNPRHPFCECNCLAGSPVRPLQHLSVLVVDRSRAGFVRSPPIIGEAARIHHSSPRFRFRRRIKNGPPSRDVITPTGIWVGAMMVRAAVSQSTKKAAPRKNDAGIRIR